MMSRYLRLAPWALLALAVLWGWYQSAQASSARERAARAALRASNEAAAHDTTRRLAGEVAKLLGDSLQAVQRLAIQRAQEADALDRALNLERIASAGLRATIRRLEARIASADTVREDSTTGTRTATWHYREPPFTIAASVSLPRPPGMGRLDLEVDLDTVPLTIRLGCGKPDRDGIRPAAATVTGPPWAALALGTVEQNEELCRSPALVKKGPSRLKWAGIGSAVTIAAKLVWDFLAGGK